MIETVETNAAPKPPKRPPGRPRSGRQQKLKLGLLCTAAEAESIKRASEAAGLPGSTLLMAAWRVYCEAHYPDLAPSRTEAGTGRGTPAPGASNGD